MRRPAEQPFCPTRQGEFRGSGKSRRDWVAGHSEAQELIGSRMRFKANVATDGFIGSHYGRLDMDQCLGASFSGNPDWPKIKGVMGADMPVDRSIGRKKPSVPKKKQQSAKHKTATLRAKLTPTGWYEKASLSVGASSGPEDQRRK